MTTCQDEIMSQYPNGKCGQGYAPLDKVIHEDCLRPKTLDFLEFEVEGITIRAYGVLHGLTGGMNQEYRDFVKLSIRQAEGLKLGEKGFKIHYAHCGIDEELEDWLILGVSDCFSMGFQMVFDPRCFFMLTIDPIIE